MSEKKEEEERKRVGRSEAGAKRDRIGHHSERCCSHQSTQAGQIRKKLQKSSGVMRLVLNGCCKTITNNRFVHLVDESLVWHYQGITEALPWHVEQL